MLCFATPNNSIAKVRLFIQSSKDSLFLYVMNVVAGSTGKCKISDLFEELGLWV